MTFDVSIYRKYVKDPSIDTRMCLSDALDEIERQAKRITELEEHKRDVQTIIGPCRELMSLAAHIEILLENTDYYTARRELNEVIDRSFGQQLTIIKQHAALKKLGQAKRERGKALVEERAKKIATGWADPDEGGLWMCKESIELAKRDAREQLRREGKI